MRRAGVGFRPTTSLVSTATLTSLDVASDEWRCANRHMKTQSFADLAAAIDCESETECIAPVVDDSTGTVVMITNDGGKTVISQESNRLSDFT